MSMENMRKLLNDILEEPGKVNEVYGERYIVKALSGVVGEGQAQSLIEQFIDFEVYLNDPAAYDGVHRGLYESLNTDSLETGVVSYLMNSGLVEDEAEGDRFYNGLKALEDVVICGDDVDNALKYYSLAETEAPEDLERSEFIHEGDIEPEFVIDAYDAYSQEEIAHLTGKIGETTDDK